MAHLALFETRPLLPGLVELCYVQNTGGGFSILAQYTWLLTAVTVVLMAVIAGLEALKRPCEVQIVSDSKYVTDAFNKHWIDGWLKKGWRGASGPVKNVDLWKRLLEAARPHQLTFIWVKGHDGHPENERCDQLATSAADGDELLPDPGV